MRKNSRIINDPRFFCNNVAVQFFFFTIFFPWVFHAAVGLRVRESRIVSRGKTVGAAKGGGEAEETY